MERRDASLKSLLHLAEKQFKKLNQLDPADPVWRKGEHDVFLAEWATLRHIKETRSENLHNLVAEMTDKSKLPPLSATVSSFGKSSIQSPAEATEV